MEQISKLEKLKLILNHSKEYYGRSYHFFKGGFISYEKGNGWYSCIDIFVDKEHRNEGKALEEMRKFETEEYKKYPETKGIFGYVQLDNPAKEISRKLLSSFGMHAVHEDDETEYWVKVFRK